MQESHDRKPDSAGLESEATSKKTLSDLEKSEKISDSKSEGSPDESQVPSPDGTVDESRNQRDDAGLM